MINSPERTDRSGLFFCLPCGATGAPAALYYIKVGCTCYTLKPLKTLYFFYKCNKCNNNYNKSKNKRIVLNIVYI